MGDEDTPLDPQYDDSQPQGGLATTDSETGEQLGSPEPVGALGGASPQLTGAMVQSAERMRRAAQQQAEGALSEKQQSINAVRDALKAARDRLSTDHPDHAAAWLAVSSALGHPTRTGGIGETISNVSGELAPIAESYDAQRRARLAALDKMNVDISGMGTGPNATDNALINAKLGLAGLQTRMANQLEIGAARYGRPGAAGAGGTPLIKTMAALDALDKNDPDYAAKAAVYKRAIAKLSGAPAAGAGGPTNGLSGDAFLATLPPAQAGILKSLKEGRMQFPSSFALKTPYWQDMLQKLNQYDPGADAVSYAGRYKTRQSFSGNGTDANNLTALGTAIHHLQGLKDAFGRLNNTRFAWVNSPLNSIEAAAGDEKTQGALADVRTHANGVAGELAKVFRSTGMSEADINHWKEDMSTNATPATSDHVISSALDLMDGRLYELGRKYNQGMGTTQDPLQLLSPKDQKIYAKLTGVAVPEATDVPGQHVADSEHGASGSWGEHPADIQAIMRKYPGASSAGASGP